MGAELRRSVWLFLLGLPPEQATDTSWRQMLDKEEHDGTEARTMHADVQRSVYSWDVHAGLRKTARNQKRIQLSEVMHAILRSHAGRLAYFQGFHEIALVFLEVGTPSQAFHMVERLALFYLSDQLCLPFDRGLTPLLGVLWCLLELLDAPLAQALAEADCTELHFAVPWVLTWFAHTLPRLHQQVMRITDCLLAGHPSTVLYFSAALLIQHRDVLLKQPRELPEMVCAIQNLPLADIDADEWASHTRRLMRQLPPEELLAHLPLEHWRALPVTSPVLHYPPPWAAGVDRAKACPAALVSGSDISRLAPIYSGVLPQSQPIARHRSAATLAIRRSLLRLLRGSSGAVGKVAMLFRVLGVGGLTMALVGLVLARR